MHTPTQSVFTIPEGAAEVTFTFYYTFEGILRCDDAMREHPCSRDWRNSELATYFSEGFLEQLLVTHFHIPTSEQPFIVKPHSTDVINGEEGPFHFSVFESLKHVSGDGVFDSIAALECTMFKSGYMSAILRFVNDTPVPGTSLISLIRHPEFSAQARPSAGLSAGALVEKAVKTIQRYEKEMAEHFRGTDLQMLSLGSGQWTAYPVDNKFLRQRSRPYVGVIFKLDKNFRRTRSNIEAIQKFVIAAGRPTPAFVTSFQSPGKYLDSGLRNVYGGGNSIVFIGRRGWCVFDGRDHHPDAFRLGVVETTHLVITAIDTASRALRRFATDVHKEGVPIFQQLNMAVNYMVRSFQGRKECYRTFHSESKLLLFPRRERLSEALLGRTVTVLCFSKERSEYDIVHGASAPDFPLRRPWQFAGNPRYITHRARGGQTVQRID